MMRNSRLIMLIYFVLFAFQSISADESDDPFIEELQAIRLMRIGNGVSFETIVKRAEELIQKYPDHPQRSKIMYHLASCYETYSVPELSGLKRPPEPEEFNQWYQNAKESGHFSQSQKMATYWAQRALEAAEIGTEDWLYALSKTASGRADQGSGPEDMLNYFQDAERLYNQHVTIKDPFIQSRLDGSIISGLIRVGRGWEALERYKQLMRRHQSMIVEKRQFPERYDSRQVDRALGNDMSAS